METSQESVQKVQATPCCPRLPVRYTLVAVIVAGTLVTSVMNNSMPVAIVAMTKLRSRDVHVGNDTCPGEHPFLQSNTAQVSPDLGEFSWDEETQARVLAGNAYGSLLSFLAGGRLAEVLGAKRVIGVGVLVASVCNLLVPFLARLSPVALVVLLFIQGFFFSSFQPSQFTLFSSWLPPKERNKISAVVFSTVMVGTLISSGISGQLARLWGWPYLFYGFGGLCLLWCALWFCLVYDTPSKHPTISEEERRYLVDACRKEDKVVLPVPWLNILTSTPVWAQISMDICVLWVVNTLLKELPTYLNNILHFDVAQAGYLTALPIAFSWSSSVFCGFLSQWLRTKDYLGHLTAYRLFNAITSLGPALCLICVTLVDCDATAIMVILCAAMFCNGAIYGGSLTNVMDLAVNFAGTISGISGTFTGLLAILGPTTVGYITYGQQTRSAWRLVFYVSAAVIGTPFFVYLFFGSVEEQPWNKPKEETGKSGTRPHQQEISVSQRV